MGTIGSFQLLPILMWKSIKICHLLIKYRMALIIKMRTVIITGAISGSELAKDSGGLTVLITKSTKMFQSNPTAGPLLLTLGEHLLVHRIYPYSDSYVRFKQDFPDIPLSHAFQLLMGDPRRFQARWDISPSSQLWVNPWVSSR